MAFGKLNLAAAAAAAGSAGSNSRLSRVPRLPRKCPSCGFDPRELTEREKRVLALISEGLTLKEIAQQLNLSLKTVDTHKYNIYRKLGIRGTGAAVRLTRLAIARGWVPVPTEDKEQNECA